MVRMAAGRVPAGETTQDTGRAPRTTRTPTAPAAPHEARARSTRLTIHFATARRVAAPRGRSLAAHPIGAR